MNANMERFSDDVTAALIADNNALTAQMERLILDVEEEVSGLHAQISVLKTDNAALTAQLVQLDTDNAELIRRTRGSSGDDDVLRDLQRVLESTPRMAYVTRPINVRLLASTIVEIQRLRDENAALLQRGQDGRL